MKAYFIFSIIVVLAILLPALINPREYGVLAFFAGFAIVGLAIIGVIISIFSSNK